MNGNYFALIFAIFTVYFDVGETADNTTTSSKNGWDNAFVKNGSSIIPLIYFGNKAYYFGTQTKLTFLQADQFCRDIHMSLASVKSSEENDFLYKYVQSINKDDHYWTSGSKLLDGKNWIWMANGEPVDYTNWAAGQPDNPTSELCLELWWFKNKGLLWNDRDCNVQFYFICDRDVSQKNGDEEKGQNWPNLFSDSTVSPNINLLNYKDKSYYIVTTFKATYLQATQFCQIIDMELVSITSDDENDRLHKYIRDTNAGDSFWSSGTKLIDGSTWIWLSTGEKVEYTHWLAGQPDSKTEYCIQLVQQRDGSLVWNDYGCDSQLLFICETSSAKRNPSNNSCPTQPITTGNCQSTSPSVPTTTVEGKQYYINSSKVSNSQAGQICKSYNMQLLSVENKGKNAAVYNLLKKTNSTESYWTSGNKLLDGKNWYWGTGKPITYFNWNTGEPNNQRSDENCIEIFRIADDAKWNDQPCEDKRSFICESIDSTNGGSNWQCTSPIVNVYVNNNIVSPNGTIIESKKVIASSDSNKEFYNVQVNNNVNEDQKTSTTSPSYRKQNYKKHSSKHSHRS